MKKQNLLFMRTGVQTILLLLLSVLAFAQSHVITGKVTDAKDNSPLPGVTVQVKGTATGTQTKPDGTYSITVPAADAHLVFSFVGYDPQDITASGNVQDVKLGTAVKALQDVVVIGYGVQKKSDATGAVSSIKSAVLNERPATNIEQELAGKVAGVNVSTNSGRPGGNTNVHIRGYNTINASNSPLYVVDGVIGAGPISYLNPNDIESMDVLKDASATAIYGARGANGVIIVTTKRGKSGAAQVSYDAYLSAGVMARKLDVLDAKQFMQVEQNSYANAPKYDSVGFSKGNYIDPKVKAKDRNLFDQNGNPLYNTDWQKEATQTAFSHAHNLSVTGGNQDNTYGLFLNYANENGIVRESYLKRYAARFVFDSQVKKYLKVGGSISFSNVDENRVDGGVGGLNATRMMIETLPIIPVTYADGHYGSNNDYPDMEGGENPVNILKNRKDLFKTQSTIGNVYANLNILPGLELRSSVGFNVNNIDENFYSSRTLRQLSADDQGEAWVRQERNNYWQFENYLTYNKRFSKNHSITALAGLSWQQYDNFYSRAGGKGFNDDFYQYYNLSVAANPETPESNYYKWAMNSYFGRVNYSFKDRYLFTVTGRMDGSSKFGANEKFAFFPSAAFAWRVSEEDFLKNNNTISNLKFRASAGLTGNSEIGVYQSLASLGSETAVLGGKRAPGVGIDRLGNPNLKWEKTAQYDAGVEIGLWKGRVNLEVDGYYKKTSDMLLDAPVPSSTGYETIYKNIGSMENRGVEVTLNTVNIESGKFSWNTTFNIAINKNKVLTLGSANDDIFPGPYFLSNTNILRVGQPVGSFYGLRRLGTYGTDEVAEAAAHNLRPGDVKRSDTRQIIGKGVPDGFGTFQNSFHYGHWDLSVELAYSYGADILNLSRHSGEDRTGQANSYATVLNGWTPEHQNTMIAQNRPSKAGYTTTIDSHMVESGDYIRGKNLLLAYSFGEETLRRLHLTRLRVYASAQNFFVSTKYSGYDPEVTTYGDAFAQGIEFFSYPKPRTYTFGMNVTF